MRMALAKGKYNNVDYIDRIKVPKVLEAFGKQGNFVCWTPARLRLTDSNRDIHTQFV